MACPDCPEDRISIWLDGELPQDEARAVEVHVDGCAGCQELVQAFGSRTLPQLEPDPSFIVRFRARRDEQSIAPWWTWRQLALRLLPLAAAVVGAAVLSIWIASSSSESSLQALELEALGDPVAFDAEAEAVLSIAFEPFPSDIE